MAVPENLTVEDVTAILNEIIETLESSSFASDLNEARLSAGNEMLRLMQSVFPMVVQVEMEVIERHGFENSQRGIVGFTQLLREMELMHPEVAQLHNRIRKHYLPPVSISSTVDTSEFGVSNGA